MRLDEEENEYCNRRIRADHYRNIMRRAYNRDFYGNSRSSNIILIRRKEENERSDGTLWNGIIGGHRSVRGFWHSV